MVLVVVIVDGSFFLLSTMLGAAFSGDGGRFSPRVVPGWSLQVPQCEFEPRRSSPYHFAIASNIVGFVVMFLVYSCSLVAINYIHRFLFYNSRFEHNAVFVLSRC